jgi:hypothetical protein
MGNQVHVEPPYEPVPAECSSRRFWGPWPSVPLAILLLSLAACLGHYGGWELYAAWGNAGYVRGFREARIRDLNDRLDAAKGEASRLFMQSKMYNTPFPETLPAEDKAPSQALLDVMVGKMVPISNEIDSLQDQVRHSQEAAQPKAVALAASSMLGAFAVLAFLWFMLFRVIPRSMRRAAS